MGIPRPVWVVALVLCLCSGAAVAASPLHRSEGGPQDVCQPDPLEDGVQTLRCSFGPVEVTPASNLILAEPVRIEMPRAEGFVVGFRPDLVEYATGEVPPIHEVHLHHGVWITARQHVNPVDTAEELVIPFAATGEEKTRFELPSGADVDGDGEGDPEYGYRVEATDEWILNYMMHNLTNRNFVVEIVYEVQWVNASSDLASHIDEVLPVWLDTVGGLYPVYDPTNVGPDVRYDPDASRPGEPDGQPVHVRTTTFTFDEGVMPMDPGVVGAELVWMAGHVHPGGYRIDVDSMDCGPDPQRLFSSAAEFNEWDPPPAGELFGSWDFRMTATPNDWRYVIRAGDEIRTETVYDIEHPWYEAMGIVFAWAKPLTEAGLDRAEADGRVCAAPDTTTGEPTYDLPADRPYYGGQQVAFRDPRDYGADEVGDDPVERIDIRLYNYGTGNKGSPPAPVRAGSEVEFVNWDAAASIYHSVTPCADPGCNLDTGQSYPLPAWDFFPGRGDERDAYPDSGQLGYGPPDATAAAQDATWDLQVPADAEVGDTFTFYCRVHPYMRGSLRVVEEATT